MKLKAEFKPQTLKVAIEQTDTLALKFKNPIAREVIERDPYEGSYEITPSSETQTLQTNGKRMTDDLIINPIPSNYGLITWNGSVLTVS